MKLIIGLGNPGEEYRNSRHNLGFRIVEQMTGGKWRNDKKLKAQICEIKVGKKRLVLAKPQTFMNNSGQAVKKLVTSYRLPVTNVCVAHDDLDIILGEYKIQFTKGPKIHQGLASVEQHLRTKDFWRARIGVRGEDYLKIKASGKLMAEDYLLKFFSQKEREIIDGVVERAAVELLNICQENNAQ